MLKPSFVPTIAVSTTGSAPPRAEPERAPTATVMITIAQRIRRHGAGARGSDQLLSQKENPIIRFRFSADPTESVAFSYSPVLESVLSLHVLTAPKHHPLQHPWVRRARSIPSSLKREIVAFRFAYDTFVPEFLMPLPSSPFRSFDEELRQLVEHDEATLAFGFLRPLWDHGGRRDERALGDSSVRDHVRRSVDELGADQELARLIFESPRELARDRKSVV